MEDTKLLSAFVPDTTHHARCVDSLAFVPVIFYFGLLDCR